MSECINNEQEIGKHSNPTYFQIFWVKKKLKTGKRFLFSKYLIAKLKDRKENNIKYLNSKY